ncbi:MAG: hypothetical protein IPN85_00135 [Flavobacteriales bacterium]|nr:hypothetical protein [Flavobacteriales bacterium]
MRKYAHIFFDLDHTLWDFRTNSRATLAELHADERLAIGWVARCAGVHRGVRGSERGIVGRYGG